jgi:aspartate racemase
MKKIGLIGGLSPESTLYYYRNFIDTSREIFREGEYPELIIYSLNFREFSENPDGWEGRKKMLVDAGKALRDAGAEILGITANTPHIVFPEVSSEVGGEWVSIIDTLADEAEIRGLSSLLLLGTKTTMSMPFYREALEKRGFEVQVPGEKDRERIDEIIRTELMFENLRSKPYFVELIESYDVDAVILGCTEIPLVIKEGDVSKDVLDTARIHLRAIMQRATENG